MATKKLAWNEVDSKVGAMTLAGAVTVILTWGLGEFGIDLPVEVGAALTTIVAFAFSWVAKRTGA